MNEQFDTNLAPLGERLTICTDYDELVSGLNEKLLAGDQLVFMSNGGFGAARQKLTMELQRKRLTPA
jgi:UDP-N-acetylmuramate-alanine ligase